MDQNASEVLAAPLDRMRMPTSSRSNPSKGHSIGLGHQGRKLNRINERGIQELQILFGHPPGDTAGASDVHRYLGVDHLRDELRQRGEADAVDTPGHSLLDQVNAFAD